MALRQWIAILRSASSIPELSKALQDFHDQHNQQIRWHVLSHASLLGCAIMEKDVKKIGTQGWLCVAVIPVSIRDRVRRSSVD